MNHYFEKSGLDESHYENGPDGFNPYGSGPLPIGPRPLPLPAKEIDADQSRTED